MTPKRYSQSAPLIQWAYLFDEVRPLQTSTCALFWRSVVLTPIKILGPALFFGGGAVLGMYVIVSKLLDWIAPGFAHEYVMPAIHDHNRAQDLTPLWWFLGIVGTAALIAWLGSVTGFWSWFHGLCKPVEIEGGLVQKGMCPADECTARLIVEEDGVWRCPRCEGQFTPVSTET